MIFGCVRVSLAESYKENKREMLAMLVLVLAIFFLSLFLWLGRNELGGGGVVWPRGLDEGERN